MTIGERIVQYRTEQTLSRLALAEKLFVSEQTVALWEEGKANPTVDDLIRLSDLLGVTIDELLSDRKPAAPDEASDASEVYEIRYTSEELKGYFKTYNFRLGKGKRIGMTVYALIYLWFTLLELPIGGHIVIGGIFALLAAYYLISHLRTRKAQRAAEAAVAGQVYRYELWIDRMTVTLSEGAQTLSEWQIPYNAIAKAWEADDFYAFTYNGNVFVLRKSSFSAYSRLHAPIKAKVKRSWLRKPAEYKIGIALFVATLLSIWAALICVGIASGFGADMMSVMWIFYLFLPIPIASIAVGILFKKKGIKTRKNIVAGVIIAILLIIYGSFTFLSGGAGFDLASVELRTGIDFPAPERSAAISYSSSFGLDDSQLITYTYELSFAEADAEAFEAQIAADARWLSEPPRELNSVISAEAYASNADYFIFFDLIAETCNTLPDPEGDPSYIYILYDADTNTAQITEFTYVSGTDSQ